MTPVRRRSRWLRYAVAATAVSVLAWSAVVPSANAAGRDDTATWAGNVANPYGGTDYFVDASAGSDTASGTARDRAWQTLARVNATTFQPGDRILLKGGQVWADQQLWPKGSGSAGKPIVIDAYGDPAAGLPYIRTNGKVASPFLSNGQKNPDTVGLTGAVNLRNQQYVHIANLELSNDDDFATDITTGSYVRDGVSVSINADKLDAGAETVMHDIQISNLDVHNIDGPSSWQKIHYGGVNFQVFGSKQWTEYGTGGYHFQDIRIADNTFTDVELHAVQFAFNWFGDAQGTTDQTGKFHEGWEQLWVRDQDFYSRDVYIGHNYAESIGQGPFQFADTQRLLAEYNEANGWLERYSQVSAGLYLWAGADSVMRFNEIYGGPANQYDATPWDLEFTNFNVTYEYNYSHDNEGGWMAYMGNSSNSIARYNLSVNDNGVIWKNMLSTNYSPTYVSNNVFVYDGSQLESFHDEVLKSRVYFFNNVFYNTSTTPTNWYRKDGALDLGVFSNNAFFESGGVASPKQPADAAAVTADPQFVGNVADYARNAGVENIRQSASLFRLKDTSPLIDKGRYNQRIGTQDFFGDPNYRGSAPDIGLNENARGAVVAAPIDNDPIENEGIDTRTNLALGKAAVASSTHPHNNFSLKAANLVDGDPSTRWAAADDATYPLTVDIDFGAATRFDEVDLSEYTDSGTDPRIAGFALQRWDDATNAWITFATGDGVGAQKTVSFDAQTSSKLRLSIAGIKTGQQYSPTMREIAVYDNTPVQTNPVVTPSAGFYDRNPSQASSALNTVSYRVDLGGDTVRSLGYVTTSGALVGSLDATDYTVTDDTGTKVYTLTPAFFADKALGSSGIVFDFASNKTARVSIEIGDTTSLEAAMAAAAAVTPGTTAAHATLARERSAAQDVLDAANRTRSGSGNDTVTETRIAAAADALKTAVAAVGSGSTPTPTATPTPSPSTSTAPVATGSSSANGTTSTARPSSASSAGVLASTGTGPVIGVVTFGLIALALGGSALVSARNRRRTVDSRSGD